MFSFTITKVPRLFKEFFQLYNCSFEDYDYCILHQANQMILNFISNKLKLPMQKMPISLDRYGNVSSGTIPLTIVDALEHNATKDEIKLITSGFGIGLSWGISSFSLNRCDVLSMIYTDDYYKEAYLV